MKKLRFYYFGFFFLLLGLPVVPLFFLLLLSKKNYRLVHKLRCYNVKFFLFLTGVKYQLICKEPIDFNKTYIFCPNHSSVMDILVFMAAIPGYYGFLGKSELVLNPVLAPFFNTLDVTVQRHSKSQAARAFLKVSANLKHKQSMVMFPEGGIFGKAPKLNRFKSGAFKLALNHKISIIPVIFPDNWLILPDEKHEFNPGLSRVILHPPIELNKNSFNDEKQLGNYVFEIIENQLKKTTDY